MCSEISPHSSPAAPSSALSAAREWMAAPRAHADTVVETSSSPRRNTAGEESYNGERSDEGNGGRPRGASYGATRAITNVISTTPKKVGGLLSGLRNPMVALKASSDGEGSSSNRDGSSEGGASPSDENEARTRLLAKIEGAKQRLIGINLERERDLEEFIAMADKVEAAGGRDTPHMARIRQHYDRKNKKSTGLIDAVQKKLAGYEARLTDLDGGGSGAAPDPLRGYTVLQGIRRTGANLKHMTSTVVSAPLELAQKLKRGTIGSNSDPIEGDLLGHSQFYSSQASRSASGISAGPSHHQQQPSSSSSNGNGGSTSKPKAATLPANMRMRPVDLEAAVAAAVAAATVPSSSSSATASSVEWPKRSSSRRTGGERNGDEGNKDYSLARMPALGAVLAGQGRGEPGTRAGVGSPESAPFVIAPQDSFMDGNSEVVEQMTAIFGEMRQLRLHNVTIVEHMDRLQEKVQHELARQEKLLAEERYKYERLEDTLNEFTDVHQQETAALKKELQSIASRIDYQYNDRFKKVEENLESTQNHMFRVENSLRSSLEVKEGGPWYNALLLSGATILVELLKIGLYLTSVVLDFFRPFTGTRTKAGFFLLVLFLSVVLLQNAGWILALMHGNDNDAAAAANSTAAPAAGQTPPLPAVQPPPLH